MVKRQVQYGYWKFDGQVRWFVKFKIPLTRDKSWTKAI